MGVFRNMDHYYIMFHYVWGWRSLVGGALGNELEDCREFLSSDP